MARMPLIAALLGAWALAPAAEARITAPAQLSPGAQATFEVADLPALTPFTLAVEPAGALEFRARVLQLTGVTDAAGAAKVAGTVPATYEACAFGVPPLTCETHPLFPGMALETSACTVPVTAGPPGPLVSAQTCVGGARSVAAGPPAVGARLKMKVAPRRVAGVRGIRWRGWGAATARGTANGRKLSATGLVDCGGRLHYSRLTVAGKTLKNLAPCGNATSAQVFASAQLVD